MIASSSLDLGCILARLDNFLSDSCNRWEWFIDESVFFDGDLEHFTSAFDSCSADFLATNVRTREEDPEWYWWGSLGSPDGESLPKEPLAAFLPLWRINRVGAREILRGIERGWVGFSEALIPTICQTLGLKIEDIGGTGRFTPLNRVGRWYGRHTWQWQGPIQYEPGLLHHPVPICKRPLAPDRVSSSKPLNESANPKILYVSPVGGEAAALLPEVLARFLAVNAECWLLQYGELDIVIPENVRVIREAGFKFQLALRHLHPDAISNYDYIFLWDDDLRILDFDPLRFCQIMKYNRLDMAQPAIRSFHGLSHSITAPHPAPMPRRNPDGKTIHSAVGRLTNFVEIMAPVFSREAWREFYGYLDSENRSGWGYDYIPLARKGIIDSLPVEHTRAVQSIHYNSITELDRFLTDQGLYRYSPISLGILYEGLEAESAGANCLATQKNWWSQCVKKKEDLLASPFVKERFLILTREFGIKAENLLRVLDPLGRVEVVVDRETPAGAPDKGRDWSMQSIVWVSNEEVDGIEGLMGRTSDFPQITAWTRALAHLRATLREDEAVWFVEDDVAGDFWSWENLVNATKNHAADLSALSVRARKDDPNWHFWSTADGFFPSPCRAFQPLCRLSAGLLNHIFQFGEIHGHYLFHEVLFASIANSQGMTIIDWLRDERTRRSFGEFRYRPEIEIAHRGISHPVKDERLHEAICLMPCNEFPRLAEATLHSWAVLRDDYICIVRLIRMLSVKKIVEFGPGDSTLALLDAGCSVVSFEHDLEWLQRAVERFSLEPEVAVFHCPEGDTPGSLPFNPDMVFVDGPPFREGQTLSRIRPCEWAIEVCGCFLLHDANRDGEQVTLAAMKLRGMRIIRFPTFKGLALVVDPAKKPYMLEGDFVYDLF